MFLSQNIVHIIYVEVNWELDKSLHMFGQENIDSPKSLLAIPVGIKQKEIVDQIVKKVN